MNHRNASEQATVCHQDTIAVNETNEDHLVVQDEILVVGEHDDNKQKSTNSSLKHCHKKNFLPIQPIGSFIHKLSGGKIRGES